jgi:cytochrome P450
MPQSIERIQTPAGDPAWHVTGYTYVRTLLADQQLGRAHPDPARAGRYSATDVAGRPAGGSESEYTDHAWWRKAMNKVFSPAALERLTPAVRGIADRVLADLRGKPALADLGADYSMPLTSEVMCALLGVPTSDVAKFRDWTEQGAEATDVRRSLGGIQLLMSYADALVRERGRSPGDDVVSVLLQAGKEPPRIHAGRTVKLVAGMLAFGRETPASVIDSGALRLLVNPAQRDLLAADTALAPKAVEETLRMFKPPAATDQGLQRYAHTDVEIGDTRIAKGDMVLLDLMAANHDPEVFPDPDRFDITRDPNPHLTFGYGFYMCNFTKLARIEIGIALGTLFGGVPNLQLAEPPEKLQIKDHLRTGGLARLPVSW